MIHLALWVAAALFLGWLAMLAFSLLASLRLLWLIPIGIAVWLVLVPLLR